MPEPPALWTVGHSNHSFEYFAGLLLAFRVEAVADVRSVPRSRYVPWFDREGLRDRLGDVGVRYVFLGEELGGRPTGEAFYDDEGHVRYDAVAASSPFLAGLGRLIRGMSQMRVAVMCAEEDPAHCHRRLLVARVLFERGHPVQHIRRDRNLQPETGFATQTLLGVEELPWRSSASVSPRRLQSTSSGA